MIVDIGVLLYQTTASAGIAALDGKGKQRRDALSWNQNAG